MLFNTYLAIQAYAAKVNWNLGIRRFVPVSPVNSSNIFKKHKPFKTISSQLTVNTYFCTPRYINHETFIINGVSDVVVVYTLLNMTLVNEFIIYSNKIEVPTFLVRVCDI